MTSSHLEKELDRVFSLFVRLSYADHAGYASCYTCGVRLPWRSMDCGHFERRGHHGTRWDVDNARPQCGNCNRVLNGMPDVFEENLIEDLGEEGVIEIKERALRPFPLTDEWMRERIRYFKKIVDNIGQVQAV